MLLTAGGPLVILTSHETATDPGLLKKLESKGITKFISCEIPLELAKARYGGHFSSVEHDLHETDDMRVLDYNGGRVFALFRFEELGSPTIHDTPPGSADAAVTLAQIPSAVPPPPLAGARPRQTTSFKVLVADLAGDDAAKSQTLRVVAALQRHPEITVERCNRTLSAEGPGDPVEHLAEALRTGRAITRNAGADVLVWGERPEGERSIRLRFLSAAITPRGEVRAFRPVSNVLELPDDFEDRLGEVIYGVALTGIDPATEAQAQSVLALLVPAAAVARGILDNPPSSLTARGLARIRAAHGTAAAAIGENADDPEWLERAVADLKMVLQETNPVETPNLRAMTFNALGNALRMLGELKQQAGYLEESLAAFSSAEDIYTRTQMPVHWAMLENNRAVALWSLGKRGEATEHLREAVAAYRRALEIITKERLPVTWAMTQNNLGVALRTLGQREEGTASLHEAVAAHTAALETLTRDCPAAALGHDPEQPGRRLSCPWRTRRGRAAP